MANQVFLAALVLCVVGFIFELVGLATAVWVKGPGYNLGLFVFCSGNGCANYDADGRTAAARFFASVGFLTGLAGMIVNLVYYCKHLKNSVANRKLPLAAGVLLIISGVATILVGPIFLTGDSGSVVKPDVGYSFVLSLLGGIMALVAGGLTLFHRTKISE